MRGERRFISTIARRLDSLGALTYITEVEVRERALAWVPEVMRFAGAATVEIEADDAQIVPPGGDTFWGERVERDTLACAFETGR